jgi:hypothetical protein
VVNKQRCRPLSLALAFSLAAYCRGFVINRGLIDQKTKQKTNTTWQLGFIFNKKIEAW